MAATCSSEMSIDFQGLHGVIFQMIETFITTAVRTSKLTFIFLSYNIFHELSLILLKLLAIIYLNLRTIKSNSGQ
jgi:hypothetical protein